MSTRDAVRTTSRDVPPPDVVTIEGRTPEEALAAVAERFGPQADILEARKVLRGGIGGFFAKELVQLRVRASSSGGRELEGGSEGGDASPRAQAETEAPTGTPQAATSEAEPGRNPAVQRLIDELSSAEGEREQRFAAALRRELSGPAAAQPRPEPAAATAAEERPAASQEHPVDAPADALADPEGDDPEGEGLPTQPLAPAPVGAAAYAAAAGLAAATPQPADQGAPARPASPPTAPGNASPPTAPGNASPPTAPGPAGAEAVVADSVVAGRRVRAESAAAPMASLADVVARGRGPEPEGPGETPGAQGPGEAPATPDAGSAEGVPSPLRVSDIPPPPWAPPTHGDPDRGVRWDPDTLAALGLPRALIDAVAGIGPADDAAAFHAVAAAASSLCRPLPLGEAAVVGPRAHRLAAGLELPLVQPPAPTPSGSFAAAVGADDRGWLAWYRGRRWLHLVLGGPRRDWEPLLFDEPLAVSWATSREFGRALSLAADHGLVLGYRLDAAGAPRRVSPIDVAIAVRELLDETEEGR